MKTGVKAGSVVMVEDIVLLKDSSLSVRTLAWVVVRWIKFEMRSVGLVNMVVFGTHSYSFRDTMGLQLSLNLFSGASEVHPLFGSKDEVDSALSLNDITHFSNLQSKGSIFERLLHLSRAKDTEVPTFAGGATV